MHKIRKIRLCALVKINCALSIGLFYLLYLYLTQENDYKKDEKIILIERSIRSTINRNRCRHPYLPIDNPEIMKFYYDVNKIDCGDPLQDWVACEKSICFVKPEIAASHGDVICSYTDIMRKTDYKIKYGKTTKTREPYLLQESDFVKVVCSAKSGHSYYGMAAGIKDGVPRPNLHEGLRAENSHYNVLMFGFDSLSRNAFLRKLPKSFKFLTQQLDAVVLKGYNIVGDGTPQALIPLLTGYTELELPETRKRMSGSMSVNAYPFIWSEYAHQGYFTSFNEDIPKVGTFTYRLNGFQEQPVDHYMRTFYIEAENILSGSKANCIGHIPDHLIMLDYTKNFMIKYKDAPYFGFSFHGGLSHDAINLVGAADDDVLQWLESLKIEGLLDNTIIIMMADHGNRFSEVRATLQGKQEERLPFFSFVFPPSFKQRFPKAYENFVNNANRLTTPFDVHATFKDILRLQNTKATSEKVNVVDIPLSKLAQNRAISLFEAIPENRSCADAYIEPHWCACLNWQLLSLNSTANTAILIKAAASIMDVMNNATKQWRNDCAPLELLRINWAMRLRPHREMLNYKQNKDTDGFLPDMTDNIHLHEEFYQLQIVVMPGESLFEASVSHNLRTYTVHAKLSEISRVNKYGSQADCIYERNPELRKFCYCKHT